MTSTPKKLGYQMPAEWAPHSATWLAWPYDKITFPDRVEKVELIYCQIIKALADQEKIHLLIRDLADKEKILNLLAINQATVGHWQNIIFHICDYADVWVRDYGPTFLKTNDHKKAWLKWRYNAYGQKFPDLLKDNEVFNLIDRAVEGVKFVTALIMEGGSIETNGQGVLLTTEECLLNPNRNPQLSKLDIEAKLQDYLGVNKVIWLKKGIHNDHTDGHIDILARFTKANTILLAWTDNEANPNYDLVRENLKILEAATDSDDHPFNIIKLPLPEVYYDNGELAPASYANFYIANNIILAVNFALPTDAIANDIIAKSFPDRQIINVDCRDLLYGGGELHCITQQEPA